jgi:hypothetical protein
MCRLSTGSSDSIASILIPVVGHGVVGGAIGVAAEEAACLACQGKGERRVRSMKINYLSPIKESPVDIRVWTASDDHCNVDFLTAAGLIGAECSILFQPQPTSRSS